MCVCVHRLGVLGRNKLGTQQCILLKFVPARVIATCYSGIRVQVEVGVCSVSCFRF